MKKYILATCGLVGMIWSYCAPDKDIKIIRIFAVSGQLAIFCRWAQEVCDEKSRE